MTFLDLMTLVIILFVVAALVAFALWLAALPGKIAHARDHAQADAVAVAGWLCLLTAFTTWPLVMIWAHFRPVAVRVVDEASASGAAAKGGRA